MMHNKHHIIRYLAFISYIVLSACQDEPLDIDGGSTDDLERFLQENGISATKAPEGYYFETVQTNESGLSIEDGSIVSIYYKITTLSGTIIDEFRESDGIPLKLQHGKDAVFPVGIDAGLSQMNEGEIYRFYITPELAYQAVNFAEIDTDEPVIAEVEVAEILTINQQNEIENQNIATYISQENLNNVRELSSGLRIKTLQQGSGESPGNGAEVTINYTAKFTDNTIFAEGSEIISLGDNTLIDGLEEGIRNMEFGERALIIMPSALGYHASVRVLPKQISSVLVEGLVIPNYAQDVPPFEVLLFEVTLQQQ